MKIFSKVCLFLLVWLLVSILNFSGAAQRQKFVQDDWGWKLRTSPNVEAGKVDDQELTGNIAEWTAYETNKLSWILQFPERSEYSTPLWYALKLIQFSINWILWILSFVALMYKLYCWFLVFSSGSDDKNMQKGKKWISTAAIALAWIWLSWLIISAMIWFISSITKVN